MDLTCGGQQGARDQFEQGAFASAIAAHNAHGFTGLNLEIQVLEHPLQLMVRGGTREPIEQACKVAGVVFERFAQLTDFNGGLGGL